MFKFNAEADTNIIFDYTDKRGDFFVIEFADNGFNFFQWDYYYCFSKNFNTPFHKIYVNKPKNNNNEFPNNRIYGKGKFHSTESKFKFI